MTDTANIQGESPTLPGFTLDHPVKSGDQVVIPAGTRINVRKPDSGELRGLKLLDLHNLDVASLEVLAPRITTPAIHKGYRLDPADMMQFGGEVLDFLLPKAARPDSHTA